MFVRLIFAKGDYMSKDDLDMDFVVRHPLFGFAFSYTGYFDFID